MKKFMDWWNSFYPTPLELAMKEYAEAKRSLLEAQIAVDNASRVAAYRTKRVEQLKKYINEGTK